jgi:hypothetical protein
MPWQLLWQIEIRIASPEQLAMQELLAELQFPRRRWTSARQDLHSGGFERIASGRRVEDR